MQQFIGVDERGIAPRYMATRWSRQNLRTRIHYHVRGSVLGSTLRLTLGCLSGPGCAAGTTRYARENTTPTRQSGAAFVMC
ncbi:GIY-YIG nuclease family protein [Streptomyces sp. NPDC058691]|uniref:GIY-YIG nuclease family protein n=1 Tax=Streptomyces sp. NPDC058691 TaxID=3346601 RepID=UPI00364D89D1